MILGRYVVCEDKEDAAAWRQPVMKVLCHGPSARSIKIECGKRRFKIMTNSKLIAERMSQVKIDPEDFDKKGRNIQK